MSGPELQARLGELGSTIPIIFVTGYPDVRTTVRTIKAGGEDFLIKPVHLSSFSKLFNGPSCITMRCLKRSKRETQFSLVSRH
jgi:FixJ family two-component response regulator